VEAEGHACLTEYHGLTPRQLERLEGEGFSREKIGAYDESLRGIALPHDYYGYENLNGFVETGTAIADDPREELASLRSELDAARTAEQDGDLSESVLKQLEDLGYT
jgi:arylsulfatase